MANVVWDVTMSLDGFTSGPNVRAEEPMGDGEFAFGTLEDSVRRAREAAGDKNVMVLGAYVARQLMRAGHLDQLWLHICPKLLGAGTPMFAGERETLIPNEKPLVGNATHHFFTVGKS